MTSVIDKKAEKRDDRSTLDRGNSMLKLIEKQYFLKKEEDICYFTPEEDSKYIHKEFKERNETSDACESLEILKKRMKFTNSAKTQQR